MCVSLLKGHWHIVTIFLELKRIHQSGQVLRTLRLDPLIFALDLHLVVRCLKCRFLELWGFWITASFRRKPRWILIGYLEICNSDRVYFRLSTPSGSTLKKMIKYNCITSLLPFSSSNLTYVPSPQPSICSPQLPLKLMVSFPIIYM